MHLCESTWGSLLSLLSVYIFLFEEAIYFEEIKRLQAFIQGTINKPLVKGLLLNHAYLDEAILRNWKGCLEEKKQAVLKTIKYERETAKRQAGIRQQEYDLNENILVEKHEEELRVRSLPSVFICWGYPQELFSVFWCCYTIVCCCRWYIVQIVGYF